jgi:hypothetical protein
MSNDTTDEVLFQPIVTVQGEKIETDWFDSLISDITDAAQAASDLLDARLDAIREAIASTTDTNLADLVAPFFVRP